MAFDLTLNVNSAPHAVLAAIVEDAREWHESAIPAGLRAAGVLKVTAKVRGSRFWLRFDRGIGGPQYDFLQLRGSVVARPGGGTAVSARCGKDRAFVPSVAVLGGLALWILLSGGGGAGWVAFAAFGVLAFRAIGDANVSRAHDPEARYLAERLEQAVTRKPCSSASIAGPSNRARC